MNSSSWQIPAKTFLLGEYAALAGKAALLLTTEPCFELKLNTTNQLHNIHPESPAGLWWQAQGFKNHGLEWQDPYQGRGGLGASTAQFIAAYKAGCWIENKTFDHQALLQSYFQYAWQGQGLKPSGYDLLAQTTAGIVYINEQQIRCNYDWPFPDLNFILIHTGKKLATHDYLKQSALTADVDTLNQIVEQGRMAFEEAKSSLLITAVNDYHQTLNDMGLVANHSLEIIRQLNHEPEIQAIKGCGAMGADILLLLCHKQDEDKLKHKLQQKNLTPLETKQHHPIKD